MWLARFPPGFHQVSARVCGRETQVSPPSAGGPQSLAIARGVQSLAEGRPGGKTGGSAQCAGHPTILLPVQAGTDFLKQLKKAEASARPLASSQGRRQVVANETVQLYAAMALGGCLPQAPLGGNPVRLIKQEKLEPSVVTVAPGVVDRGGLPSWKDMQQGGKRKWSDHSEGGSHIKRHRVQSSSDSDSCMSCSSQLGADQENLLSELLEDSAPDSTLGQDRSHWKTCQWVAACTCAEVGISPIRNKPLRSTSQRRKEMQKRAYEGTAVKTSARS